MHAICRKWMIKCTYHHADLKKVAERKYYLHQFGADLWVGSQERFFNSLLRGKALSEEGGGIWWWMNVSRGRRGKKETTYSWWFCNKWMPQILHSLESPCLSVSQRLACVIHSSCDIICKCKSQMPRFSLWHVSSENFPESSKSN